MKYEKKVNVCNLLNICFAKTKYKITSGKTNNAYNTSIYHVIWVVQITHMTVSVVKSLHIKFTIVL